MDWTINFYLWMNNILAEIQDDKSDCKKCKNELFNPKYYIYIPYQNAWIIIVSNINLI